MKNITYNPCRLKEHTISLELTVQEFFRKLLGNIEIESKISLLSIEDIQEDIKVSYYQNRDLCKEIQDDLRFIYDLITDPQRKDWCKGDTFYFSTRYTYNDIEGDYYIALKYDVMNNLKNNEFVLEYVTFQMKKFLLNFESLINSDEYGDTDRFLERLINESGKDFIEKKLTNEIDYVSDSEYVTIDLSRIKKSYAFDIRIIEKISQMPYESKYVSKHKLVISKCKQQLDIEFEEPKWIKLSNLKATRKLLEITANSDLYLLSDGRYIRGFVSLNSVKGNYYLINFKGINQWSVSYVADCEEISKLPNIEFGNKNIFINNILEDLKKDYFYKCYNDVFHRNCVDKIWNIVKNALTQEHGTLLIFFDHNKIIKEKKRLKNASFNVDIQKNYNENIIKQISAIDGAILMDENGTIHSIGLILDGLMDEIEFDISRGARYNSAIKYTAMKKNSGEKCLAVVISEDKYFNLISEGKEMNKNLFE